MHLKIRYLTILFTALVIVLFGCSDKTEEVSKSGGSEEIKDDYLKVLSEQEISSCENAGKMKASCYAEKIISKEGFESCEGIGDTEVRDACYYYIAVDSPEYKNYDFSFCHKIQDVNKRDACFSDVSTGLKDESGCENIGQEGYMEECYFQVALEKQDSSICNKIKDSENKEFCVASID